MRNSHLKTGSGFRSRTSAAAVFLGVFILASGDSLQAQPVGGLYSPKVSFNTTNRIVSASVFHWYTSSGGQLSGPWRPLEGRSNWTGEPDFWKGQIKQMMMANIDMLYVHLIPSSEQQRINLFQALNQLRYEGYDVPKVAPFLDPMITWDQQPLVNLATTAGKDTFVNQYIRFFNQYYSVNPDTFADDYLARIANRVVLDTWHVKFNVTNLNALTRQDVANRLVAAFGPGHSVFSNGIYMVTTALNDPTLSFADEKVPQFEISEYYRLHSHLGIAAVQLKGGYWDQNIRNPGSILKRNGGNHFTSAWNMINRNTVRRVYIESWNEYDEGSGIYAANTGPPYIQPGSGNTNTDSWSSANDPFEYIRSTARGAATFNDTPDRDAKILWHNIPDRMFPGETRTVTVIVRNEGDVRWTEAAKYRFGQKDYLDPIMFGPGRYLINDAQDEIPTYGGIFRGRPKTFQVTMRAPMTPGVYTTHWGMLQELVTWFGEEIVQNITVDSTPILRGSPQSIDSMSVLTNSIDDYSEHTYRANAGPIGSFAECPITRTFAAPIKSIKVTIESGTADDIGYVGNILVTPNSVIPPDCATLGRVLKPVDVSSQVSINGNTATLVLRTKENCCCETGWGEDTASGRANARLHWQVTLSPPVPISPVFTNSANGHYYVLLSPATWAWSERVGVALGGHLATVRSQAEQNWIYDAFSRFGGLNRLLWIGLNDVATEGRFAWSSGEPVNFTHWSPGEPNNALTGEDFVTMYQPGHTYAARWNDWGERVFDGNRPFNGVLELMAPMGPPTITQQPRGGKAIRGAAFRLSVTASGSPMLQYQWRFNGANIAGATNRGYTLTDIQFANAGNYSVLVTNLLGQVESLDATLIVNHSPVANPQSLSLDEDSLVAITLSGTDADGDGLAYIVIAPPVQGSLTGVAPNLTYQPEANYNGPDSFTFRVNDGMLGSPVATININVRPVNDSPDAQSQSLSLDEDTGLGVTLTAFDVDGDALTYAISAQPTHGTLTGTPPNVSYQPNTNYFGPDSFAFTANDGKVDSQPGTVNLTVSSVNDPPLARIRVSPRIELIGLTNLWVIASICTNTTVVLDGSQSSDSENDPLQYSWFQTGDTNAFATGVVAVVTLPVGTNLIGLTVSDGAASDSATASIEVITPRRALARLLLGPVHDSKLPRGHKLLLSVALLITDAALHRERLLVAVSLLEGFKHQVGNLVAPADAALAEALTESADQIRDSLLACVWKPGTPHGHVCKIDCRENGRMRIHFPAPRGATYIIEASSNLVDWERVGVATRCEPDGFEFEDAAAQRMPARFYRVVVP